MKKSIKLLPQIAIICIALGLFSACNEEDFLTEEARSQLTIQDLYSSQAGFESTINGLYNYIRELERGLLPGSVREPLSGRMIAGGTDNAYSPVVRNQELPWVQWGDYNNSTHNDYEAFFNRCYQIIRSANVVLNRAQMEGIEWDNQNAQNEIMGQASLFRAWTYRHLTYLWGDVPLITEEITGNTFRNDWERTPRAEIYAQMEQDYLFAEANLPEVHSLAGRVNKAVAQHYLAELYLVLGQPDKAEAKAQAAIDNPNFKLITERYGVKAGEPGVPFMDQFYDGNALYSEGNTEGLWNFPFNRDIPGGGANRMRRNWLLWYHNLPNVDVHPEAGRGAGWNGLTKYALDVYDDNDDRGSEYAIWRYVINVHGDTIYTTTDPDKYIGQFEIGTFPATAPDRPYNWPSTRKWDDAYMEDINASEGYKDQPYLRLAETYLILAEAQYLQNKLDQAAETINVIRRRANADEITAADVDIDFILDERSRELITEEHRRYTLLRLGLWLERTKMYNAQAGPYITERDKLYPIPQSVIDANIDREFPQNPGY